MPQDNTSPSTFKGGGDVPRQPHHVLEQLLHVDLAPAFWPDLEGMDQATLDAREARARKEAAFSQARRNGIEKLLHHRHGGQCDTDDAEIWLEAAIPHVVEAAEIRGHSAIVAGLKWSRKFCPLVPLDVVVGLVRASLDRRGEATEQQEISGRFVQWLPDGDTLLNNLRPTWGEVTSLGLRGFASINPPTADERKARKTEQRRLQRQAKGTKPRSSQTIMKTRERIAEAFGVTARTVQRWELAGTVPAADVQRMSPRNEAVLAGDTNWTSPPPANENDDVDLEPAQVDEVAVVIDATAGHDEAKPEEVTVAETIMREGFTGRNITIPPHWAEIYAERYPHLRDKLPCHLTEIDKLMAKTKEPYRLVVIRNLLGDRNRAAARAKTKAAA